MNIVDLIKNERIPWVIIKEICDYNRRSIHNLVKEDVIIYELIHCIKSLFKVQYYGGHETILKGTKIRLFLDHLNKNHPDFILKNENYEKNVITILKTFRKVVQEYILKTPIPIVESEYFNYCWRYISDIYDILYIGLKQ